MPHSIRAKLSGLRYKGLITDKEYQRLCKALDNEKSISNIILDITEERKKALDYPNFEFAKGLNKAFDIIDEHIFKE